MRVFTVEQIDELSKNKVYRTILDAPPPDFTALRKEADVFARWIAREHRKERESLRRARV